jgi:periplasmic divalent cation tolerance protein
METSRYIVVLMTAPSPEIGQQIAQALVEQKLAACVNLVSSIRSIYAWEGKINTDDEVLLVVKTRQDLFADRLIPTVKALHPYQTPEIIALPILAGAQDYLDWIERETVGRDR